MKTKSILRTLIISTILISNIGCDQISKDVVRDRIKYHDHIEVLSNYLVLTKVENTGAFLSVGSSMPQYWRLMLLTILPMMVLGAALLYLMVKKNLPNVRILALCFIIGGGVGNIYDRLVYGSVTDFLHIDFVIFQTGIFNMADVSIMVGTFMMLWESLIFKVNLDIK